jgi:GNAT superfamily N-acetyltransferase
MIADAIRFLLTPRHLAKVGPLRRNESMERDDIAIRLATAGDDEQCARIFLAARRAAFHWGDPSLMKLEDYARDTEGEEVWVAVHRTTVAGFAAIYLQDGHNFLHHMFIDPSLQRRGIGSRLLRHVLTRLGRPASLKCLVANTPARAFYAKRGWIESEGGDSPLGPYVLCTKPT